MSFSKESSKLFGLVANFKFFKPLQNCINQAYVNYFKIDLSEFKDVKSYESLNALFTRELQIPRQLDEGFISPSDGKILECGEAFLAQDEAFAFSIKGHTYSVDELVGKEENAFKEKLEFVNIYLSPKDYHRYHAPCDMEILSASYKSGSLFSVNEKHLERISNLYTKNERVSLKCKSSSGFIFYLVFVGAQNVGKMRFKFDSSIQTNAKISHDFKREYQSIFYKKGEELGNFELGSTIVLLTQKGHLNFNLKAKQNVKFGEKIADFV